MSRLLAVLAVVFDRVNVNFLGMTLKGPLSQIAPQTYFPSLWECGLSIGLVAAAILAFRIGASQLPVLAKDEPPRA